MEEKTNKRKRNRKYFERKKARKYEKLGKFGRGTRVDEETYQYFMKIFEVNIEKLEDKEEQATIACNALSQTEGKEVDLSLNQFISKVIENLLPHASDEYLERFIDAFIDLRKLCNDNFASFVVQALVKLCAKRFRESGNEKFSGFVVKTSSFIFNNLEEFIYSSYANHVGRTCIKECSGSTDEVGISPETVVALGKRMLKWPELKGMSGNVLTSGFLQALLEGLSLVNYKVAKKIIDVLLEEYFLLSSHDEGEKKDVDKIETSTIPEYFTNKPSTRLLETIIEVAKTKTFNKIYLQIFINRMKTLSCNKTTSFAVQKFISSCQEPSLLSTMMDEVAPAFSEIISAGLMNIILSLGKACARLGVKEGDFLKALKTALDAGQSTSGELILKLIYPNRNHPWKKVDLLGSLLLQTLFQFKKPISVVESFLAVDSSTLKDIFTDPRGSHLADAFVSSKTIGEKSRDRLIQALKGHFKDLAMDKFGSRVIEAFWSKASLKEKHIIMDELNRSIAKTMYGGIISEKLRLGLYLSDKAKWSSKETASPKKVFSKILEEEVS